MAIANITDDTSANLIVPINQSSAEKVVFKNESQNAIDEAQKAQWEREDAIRKETQEREDTAYQRAVEDARKSGINPNLINLAPASSGGGITSATGKDYTPQTNETSRYSTEQQKALEEYKTKINAITTISEGEKERLIKMLDVVWSNTNGSVSAIAGIVDAIIPN